MLYKTSPPICAQFAHLHRPYFGTVKPRQRAAHENKRFVVVFQPRAHNALPSVNCFRTNSKSSLVVYSTD